MSAEGWPAGTARIVLPETDSTMAEAARRRAGLAGPAWILALRQTAARGRRGRPWVDPGGNFAATLVMSPPGDAGAAAQRSFVAALALDAALVAVGVAPGRLALKWPNDVLLDGGKLAGILLEAAGQGGRVEHLAIGIGVNLAAAPPAASLEPGALPPVALAPATGLHVAPEAFLDALAPAYARFEARLVAEGFAPIRAAWLARAARIGQSVTARTARETLHGRFATIDAAGALVLETEAGRRTVTAADIFF